MKEALSRSAVWSESIKGQSIGQGLSNQRAVLAFAESAGAEDWLLEEVVDPDVVSQLQLHHTFAQESRSGAARSHRNL